MQHLIYATAQEHAADLHREAANERAAALARANSEEGRRYRTLLVKHYRIAIATVAFIVAAAFATSAYARPISSAGPYGDTSVPAGPVTATPAPSHVRVVSTSSDSGFDWGDAGIGAGAALALSTMGVGGAVLVAGSRRRKAAA
jgi:hypothetical protein